MRTWIQTLLYLFAATSAFGTNINQFPLVPADCTQPAALALDAHGAVWYGCAGLPTLVKYENQRSPYTVTAASLKISGTESMTVVHLPSEALLAETMSFDHLGNLWFPTLLGDKIVRYDPATGVTRVFPVAAGSRPVAVIEGPDGNIWFTTYAAGKVGRLNPTTGAFTEFAFTALGGPYRITVGPDGNLWVGSHSSYVARVQTSGVITEYLTAGAVGVTFGPDGNLWSAGGNSVTRFNVARTAIDVFTIPDVDHLHDIALAPDETLWWSGFSEATGEAGRIGQITLRGDVAPVIAPASAKYIFNLAVRPSDGQVFYSDIDAHEIGVISPAFATAPDTTVIEFHNAILNHYFITANVEEATGIDSGTAGPGWSRTGQTFKAWLAGPIPQAGRICRFYGTPGLGPNSHFFTIVADECALVRQDPGWTLEGAGRFWLVPVNAGCPSFTQKVLRVYNNRFAFNDSNHRYLTDGNLYNQMVASGWTGEGVVFCAPL